MHKKIKGYAVVLLLAVGVVLLGFRENDAPPTSRIGYVSITSLVQQIPEYTAQQGKLDTLTYELNLQFQNKVQEFQQKQAALVKDSLSMNALIKQDKKEELRNLSQSIQSFQQKSELEISKMDSLMVQPILNQVQKAIDQVAEQKGYSHIINRDVRSDSGPPLLLYAREDSDVSKQVLEAYFSTVGK